MNRREFLSYIITALVAIFTSIPIIGYLIETFLRKPDKEKKWVFLGPIKLFTDATYRVVEYRVTITEKWRKKTYVRRAAVRRIKEDFLIFSTVCTHLNCWVNWNEKEKRFECPCHGGVFSEKGEVLSGPPPKPLRKLKYTVKEDGLYIET